MYEIEIKPAPRATYFSPDEARNYYGRYGRDGITIHWWGDGTGADNHDNIVNFFLRRQDGSVNYVLSDNKITLMVNPDNVAWTSQSGNATTISIEHQPTLGAEGYKKSGWLVSQLEQRYGKRLQLFPHKYWFATQCPGTIDINRIRAEADKWASGAYTPAPTPKPTPAPTPPKTVNLEIKDIQNVKVKLTKDANLWNLQFSSYPSAQSVKTIAKDTEFEVSAVVKHPLGSRYYISEYSYAKGIPNGINVKDTDQPDPDKLNIPVNPPPVVVPAPVTPKPEPPVPVVVDPTKGTSDEKLNWIIGAIKAILSKLGINL